MAYDEGLAQRIKEFYKDVPNLEDKKMFGGVGYLYQGNMACGVHKDKLIIRVGADDHEKALAKEHTAVFDITGRAMKGWVMVDAAGFENDEDLKEWVLWGLNFAKTLPAK